jgi:hypothetical protein
LVSLGEDLGDEIYAKEEILDYLAYFDGGFKLLAQRDR